MENETQNTPIENNPINHTVVAPHDKASTSGIIGTVIIIALIILGGLYFWGKRINVQKESAAIIQQEQTSLQQAKAIETVSEEDDVATLKAELETTTTSDLGTELQ
ncbi:MAG: hypothetical protein ACYCZW_02795 [Minisyncoccota bacterium]